MTMILWLQRQGDTRKGYLRHRMPVGNSYPFVLMDYLKSGSHPAVADISAQILDNRREPIDRQTRGEYQIRGGCGETRECAREGRTGRGIVQTMPYEALGRFSSPLGSTGQLYLVQAEQLERVWVEGVPDDGLMAEGGPCGTAWGLVIAL